MTMRILTVGTDVVPSPICGFMGLVVVPETLPEAVSRVLFDPPETALETPCPRVGSHPRLFAATMP